MLTAEEEQGETCLPLGEALESGSHPGRCVQGCRPAKGLTGSGVAVLGVSSGSGTTCACGLKVEGRNKAAVTAAVTVRGRAYSAVSLG